MAGAFSWDRLGFNTIEQILGYGLGGAVTPVVEWAARPITYELNAANPNLILVPEILAQNAIKNPERFGQFAREAAENGLNQDRFELLMQAIDQPPALGELLELLRRNIIGIEEFERGLRSGLIENEWIALLSRLARTFLSPADAAMARQQGFISADESYKVGEIGGVTREDMDTLFNLSGLPPGAEQMIELWRRGKVTEERVRQSLIEGHTKIKYVDDVLELRYTPLSASVAAEALVRQRIPESRAIAIADENGIQRDDFLLWSDMLGRPIATGQALILARRGEMNFEQFKEAVARSDVRTEYADDLWKLRRAIPGLFQIRNLISSGAITEEYAAELVTDLGYDKELAAGIAHAAKKTKTQRTRDLAAGQIDALYESGLETRQWALDALRGLGYSDDEAEWHLELLDAKRILAALQSRISLIHRQYVTHKKSQAETEDALAGLGLQTDAKDLLMEQWDAEREEYVVRLTNAQIGSALKHKIIEPEDAIARWIANGYPKEDAEILAAIATKAPHNATSPTA